MKRGVLISVMSLLFLGDSVCKAWAGIGQWKNFTDMKSVRAAVSSSDSIWAATSGGLFLYRPSTGKFTKYTNSEGLSSIDLTSVVIDNAGSLWVGASDGSLNALDALGGEFREIRGIKESSYIQKRIRNFFVQGDSLFIASDFGVTVYLVSRSEFGDTYANFGFPVQAKVNAILLQRNQLWVATDQGVASASLSASNLSSPTAWKRYQTSEGLPSITISSVVALHDTVVVGTANGAAFFANNIFQELAQFSRKSITALRAQGNKLYTLSNAGSGFSVEAITSLTSPNESIAVNTDRQGTALLINANVSDIWVGTDSLGIAQRNGSTWRYFAPDGPQSNLFLSVAIDVRGVLWAASGISGRGAGFYRYDPSLPEKHWENFTQQLYPIMDFNDYYKVSVPTDSSVWVSSWGRGVVEVVKDTIRRRIHSTSVPSLAGAVQQDLSFVVVGSVAADPDGKPWFVDRTAIDGNYLAQLKNDTSFLYYKNSLAPTEGRFTAMVVDRFGTKWLANSEPWNKPAAGLFYFNQNKTVGGSEATDGWGQMTTSDGLPDNNVLSLAVDLDGDVCVGTDLGMIIINNPRSPKLPSSKTGSRPLVGQTVQAIAVDGLNNKWVGTKEGVFVISPDGVQLVGQYSVSSTNGKLIDNDVRSIAIDQKRGIVYFGTEKGLSSLEIAAVHAARSFTTLEFTPNPYLIPTDQLLNIQNLVANSSIKILSVDGKLVSEFPAQGGGRAFWDGKDANGKYVSSGIYFVVAYSENGDQVIAGKVAVVRR